MIDKLKKGKAYLEARLKERSTRVGLTLAISAAAALPHPWDIVSFIVGAIGALVPDSPDDKSA